MVQALSSNDLSDSWRNQLKDQFDLPYMLSLMAFLIKEQQADKLIYPNIAEIFAAFDQTPFEKVKIVIIGQDPYHGESQAHGLSFSVPHGIKIPPSLVNIYKELSSDLSFNKPEHGNLQAWAEQGVLLLNAVLTVEHQKPASHQGQGWEQFTDAVIARLNSEREHLVFLLWGKYAQQKGQNIDKERHLVLQSVHPSPLSAYRGFFGCQHFSKANEYLEQFGQAPIQWQI